jgi:hypothetical protein
VEEVSGDFGKNQRREKVPAHGQAWIKTWMTQWMYVWSPCPTPSNFLQFLPGSVRAPSPYSKVPHWTSSPLSVCLIRPVSVCVQLSEMGVHTCVPVYLPVWYSKGSPGNHIYGYNLLRTSEALLDGRSCWIPTLNLNSVLKEDTIPPCSWQKCHVYPRALWAAEVASQSTIKAVVVVTYT